MFWQSFGEMKRTKGKLVHVLRGLLSAKMMNTEMCKRRITTVSKPSGEEHETWKLDCLGKKPSSPILLLYDLGQVQPFFAFVYSSAKWS